MTKPQLDASTLQAALRDFYDRVFSDPMIGFLFEGKNKSLLVEREFQFVSRFFGDKSITYAGRPMRDAHAGIPIMGGHFERRQQLLRETLADHGVASAVQKHWLDHNEKLRAQITPDSGSECRNTTATARPSAPRTTLYSEKKDTNR